VDLVIDCTYVDVYHRLRGPIVCTDHIACMDHIACTDP